MFSSPFPVQHEAAKMEMTVRQRELDQFSSKGKQLLSDLKKIPDCEVQLMKKDMETLVDHWLDVSEDWLIQGGRTCGNSREKKMRREERG